MRMLQCMLALKRWIAGWLCIVLASRVSCIQYLNRDIHEQPSPCAAGAAEAPETWPAPGAALLCFAAATEG
jgi:hypothetical protein